MSYRISVLALLVVVGAASLAQDTDTTKLERDIASIETRVRIAAFADVKALEDAALRDRLLDALAGDAEARLRGWALEEIGKSHGARVMRAMVAALGDPDDRVERVAAEWLVNASADETAYVDTQRILTCLTSTPVEMQDRRFHIVQILETLADNGVVFAPGSLLRVALEAKDRSMLVDRSMHVAFLAAEAGPVTSIDLATIESLGDRFRDPGDLRAVEMLHDRIRQRLRAR